jgi:predicted transcriptional regulator
MLEDSRAKIADLEMKMQGRTAELSKLQGLIRFMESELAKKEETINQLLEELDKKNANIAQLSRNVQELSIAKDSLIDEVKSTQKSLAEAKVVYYLVADKKKLESLGIYKAGNITRKASLDFQNLNPTGFTKAKPEAMEIPISGKKPTVMTGHPASSYELRSNSKTEHVLVITDPTNFWSNSKFLVVRIE